MSRTPRERTNPAGKRPGKIGRAGKDASAVEPLNIVHGDLSAYNMLWWQGRLVIIDFPQSVDAFANPHAPDLLHRDLRNVHEWFSRQKADFDVEEIFVELVTLLYGGPAADKLKRRQPAGRKIKHFDLPEPR